MVKFVIFLVNSVGPEYDYFSTLELENFNLSLHLSDGFTMWCVFYTCSISQLKSHPPSSEYLSHAATVMQLNFFP